ncbi:MAG: cytochrome c maturation protein CcmE [Bacillota bacterium]
MNKKTKVTLGVLLIAAAIVFLMITAFGNSSMYYLTVDEALAKSGEITGRPVRLNGGIQQDSVTFDIQQPLLVFNLTSETGSTLKVAYRGVKPDNMAQATQAIVEGKLLSDGTFDATKLMLSCPSKYEGRTYDGRQGGQGS